MTWTVPLWRRCSQPAALVNTGCQLLNDDWTGRIGSHHRQTAVHGGIWSDEVISRYDDLHAVLRDKSIVTHSLTHWQISAMTRFPPVHAWLTTSSRGHNDRRTGHCQCVSASIMSRFPRKLLPDCDAVSNTCGRAHITQRWIICTDVKWW